MLPANWCGSSIRRVRVIEKSPLSLKPAISLIFQASARQKGQLDYPPRQRNSGKIVQFEVVRISIRNFTTTQNRKTALRRLSVVLLWCAFCKWLRGRDLNPRPLGYELD